MQQFRTRSEKDTSHEAPRSRFPVVFGLLSGVLGALAFPDFHIWPLACIAYVPLLVVIRHQRARVRFVAGLATGAMLHLIVYHWVRHTMISMSDLSPAMATGVLFAFALTSGLLQGVFACIAEPIRTRLGRAHWWVVPAAYTVLEYVFPHLFSWYLGNALYRQITVIQISDLTGVYGLSFVLMATNCLLADLIHHIRNRHFGRQIATPAVVVVILWLFVIAYGAVRRHQIEQLPELKSLSVAAVQPYVTPEDKKLRGNERKIILEKALAATKTLPQKPFDVIIWPEGSFPYYYPSDANETRLESPQTLAEQSAAKLIQLVRSHNTHWIFGTLRESAEEKTHNSLIHLDGAGKLTTIYDKQKLVAFGEYMPLSDTFPQLKSKISGISDMSPGRSPGIFEIKGIRILPSICYEAIFPNFTRVSANYQGGADLMVNLTNDVWFGEKSAPELHLMVQTHRAVELRLPLVRVTNSGITAFVSATGEITDRTPIHEATVLTGQIPIKKTFSIYRQVGDVFVYILAALGLMALLRK